MSGIGYWSIAIMPIVARQAMPPFRWGIARVRLMVVLLAVLIPAGIVFWQVKATKSDANPKNAEPPINSLGTGVSNSIPADPAQVALLAADGERAAGDLFVEELAGEQLRPVFQIIVDAVPAEQQKVLWDSVTTTLTPELAELALTLSRPLDAAERSRYLILSQLGGGQVRGVMSLRHPDARAQHLKEKMIIILAEQVRGERNRTIDKDLLDDMATVARKVVEHFERELAEKIGRPVGEKYHLQYSKEAALRSQNLAQAEALVGSLAPQLKQYADQYVPIRAGLIKAVKAVNVATDKKDSVGRAAAVAELRRVGSMNAPIYSAIVRLISQCKGVTAKLEDLPACAQRWKTDVFDRMGEAQEKVLAAGKATSAGDHEKATTSAEQAMVLLQSVAEAAEQFRLVLQLQRDREQLETIALRVLAHTRLAATAKSGSVPVGLLKELTDTTAMIEKLASRIDQVRMASEATRVKADEEGQAARRIIDGAKADLEKVELTLTLNKAEDSTELLKSAGEKFVQVDTHLQSLQSRLGVRNEANTSAHILHRIQLRLNDGTLALPIKEQFEKLYHAQTKKQLIQKLEAALAKRMQSGGIDPATILPRFRAELDKRFGSALMDETAAGTQVAKGLVRHLPPSALPSNVPAPVPDTQVEAVQRLLTAQAAQALPGILDGVLIRSGVEEFAVGRDRGPYTVSLQKRLDTLVGLLATGNRDYIGRADSAGLAAALVRHQDRLHALQQLAQAGEIAALKERIGSLRDERRTFAASSTAPKVDGATIEKKASVPEPRQIANAPPIKMEPRIELRKDRIAIPPPKQNRLVAIPFRESKSVAIDGKLNEWRDVPPIHLEAAVRGKNTGIVKVEQQAAWIAWTSVGVYVAVDVVDTTGKLESDRPLNDFWTNDAVEIYFDMLNTKHVKRGEEHTHQFYAFPFGHKLDLKSGGFEALAPPDPDKGEWKRVPLSADLFRRAAAVTERGWSMEMFIPRSILRKGELGAGQVIGFNLQIDTGSDLYFFFCWERGIPSQHPNTWGNLELLGVDAKLELLNASGTEELVSVIPGKTFRIRVTDHDMNRDDTRKEKIAVGVRTDAGMLEVLSLQETAAASGIFEASVPTRLASDKKLENALEVVAGERISIEHVDLYRATGERDVTMKRIINVEAAGKSGK